MKNRRRTSEHSPQWPPANYGKPADLAENDWHDGLPPLGLPDWQTWYDYIETRPGIEMENTMSDRQILEQIITTLSEEKIARLKNIALSMICGKGRPMAKRKHALLCLYRAQGLKGEKLTNKVNELTGANHDTDYYNKLSLRFRNRRKRGQ